MMFIYSSVVRSSYIYKCWTNQELREDFASKDVFYCGGASPPAQIVSLFQLTILTVQGHIS